MISRPRTRRALARLPHGNGTHRTSLQQKEALWCTKKKHASFSRPPVRWHSHAHGRAPTRRARAQRARLLRPAAHLGEALELAELRDHAQRALLDAREAKAVVERGGGHRDRRGADGGASPPPPPWTRAGGPRAGGGSSPSGGAGARADGACAVWHALQPQAYARAFICPTAHLISNDVKILTPTRKFGRLGAFHGFIWNAF